MKRLAALVCVTLSGSLGCGDGADSGGARTTHIASASCPLQTPADWQRFLDENSLSSAWVTNCSDQDNCDELSGDFRQQVQRDVLDVLASCQQDLRDNATIASCTANLRRFVPAWLQQHAADAYGFRQNNADYFAQQLASDAPVGMLDPPAALLAALPQRLGVEATAREQGYPYLTHDSCLGGSRTFFNVPGDGFEQWMLLGFGPGADEVQSGAILSFIAVQQALADGTPLERARLHFRDYIAVATDDGWSVSLPENYPGKCYACHGSGLRALVPFVSATTASAPVVGERGYGQASVAVAFATQRLDDFNQRLLEFGPPDWGDTLSVEDHGPPLGRALGCTTCHDGTTRGPLTVFTSEGMLYQKVVQQLSMRSPGPGRPVPDVPAMALLARENSEVAPLSSSERDELERARSEHQADFDSLMASRLPTWQAWIRETPCQ